MILKTIPENSTLAEVISISNENFSKIQSSFNEVFSTIETILLSINSLEVFYGTSEEDVINLLPTLIYCRLEAGDDIPVQVNWYTGFYNQNTIDTYYFTAEMLLPENVINPNNLEAIIEVKVTPIKIESFQSFSVNVAVDSTLSSLQAQLPQTIDIKLFTPFEGSVIYTIQANWTFDNFDTSEPHQFRIIALPTLPEYIINPYQVEFEAFVNVI